ncbi:MAG: gluconate 2-dehydrogenase subunit 3 family protein [Acidobacteriaceae bacterium]|nr:gluconate 2-dehydrogenase subunit 3 family protein [Acidobacteriaceae bacterium]
MDRRDLFKILGAGLAIGPELLAEHEHLPSGASPIDVAHYQPRFLSAQEYKVLGRLCDIIMPADEASPGACEAGVPFYIDSLLVYAKPELQQVWRSGLAQVQTAAKAKFDHSFDGCQPQEQEEIVADMAINETDPQTPLQSFFRPLKDLTLTGYCLSDAGMRQYLGYQGDRAIKDFPGCTHPQHQV